MKNYRNNNFGERGASLLEYVLSLSLILLLSLVVLGVVGRKTACMYWSAANALNGEPITGPVAAAYAFCDDTPPYP